jgi:hypothetical protein
MVREPEILRAYLRAVFRHWWFLVVEIVLVFVDFAERWFNIWIQPPHWLFLTIGIVVLVVAQYRAFRELYQSSRQAQNSRTSQLRIVADVGSRYILQRVSDQDRIHFSGSFLEFRLMVENTGARNSSVNKYKVEVRELRQTFTNLQSVEALQRIDGRHCTHGLQPDRVLSRTGIVRVDAESTTDRGLLLFYIPEMNTACFANAGLPPGEGMEKFRNLHCRLTLTDTTESVTAEDFELQEA